MLQILEMEARVIALFREIRYNYNLHLPVNSIPEEILAAVIELVAIDSFKDLKNVTSVCQQWRHVALNDAFLWADITVDLKRVALERTKTFLNRSRSAPLSIKMWAPPSTYSPAVAQAVRAQGARATEVSKDIGEHSNRIQNLEITVSEKSGTAALIREREFPRVESLTIGRGEHTTSSSLGEAFPSGLPKLQTLDLQFFTSWTPGLFANLTVLSLSSGIDDHHQQVPLATLLEILALSPMLELMESQNYGPRGDDESVPRRVIPLLHLRALELWDTDSRCILSRIQVPHFAIIEIHNQVFVDLGRRQPDNNQYGDFFTTVPQDLSALGLEEVESMALTIDDSVELDIRTAHGAFKVAEYCDPSADILLDDPTLINSLLDSLRSHHDFPTIKSFRVGFEYSVSGDPRFASITVAKWRGALERFPNLETLAVYECVGENLLTLLGSAFLPRLVSLELLIQKFGTPEDGIRLLESCITMVHARKQAGIPLQTLEIRLLRSSLEQLAGPSLEQMRTRLSALEGTDLEKFVIH
jgi:hypothetical protein